MCVYIYTHIYFRICLCGLVLIYACVFVRTHTPLVYLLCLCVCGCAGMEHGHFATRLNSQKRAWSWPAEQYLDSVFKRWTTTAIPITAA